VQIKGAAVDTSRAGAVGGEPVDREVRLHALEGVHVWSPLDEGEAVEHGQDADIDAVVL